MPVAPQSTFGGFHGVPGISTTVETFENEFVFGPYPAQYVSGLVIDGAARDVGNTDDTTILRSGLLLGKNNTTEKLLQWDPTALDGTEYIWGVLKESRGMQSGSTDADRLTGPVMICGGLLSNRIIVPGSTTPGIVGNANEFLIRQLLQQNFKLNDWYQYSNPIDAIHTVSAAEQSGGITLTGRDAYKEYHTDADVTITLPTTPFKGLIYTFFGDAFTITVNSGSTNIKTPGVALANTLAVLDEINQVVGTGTQWLVRAY